MTITRAAGRTGTFPDEAAAIRAMAGDVFLVAQLGAGGTWTVTQRREQPVRCRRCFVITSAPSGECKDHRPGGARAVIDRRGDWVA